MKGIGSRVTSARRQFKNSMTIPTITGMVAVTISCGMAWAVKNSIASTSWIALAPIVPDCWRPKKSMESCCRWR